MAEPKDSLEDYKLEEKRESQREICGRLLSGKSALCIVPTEEKLNLFLGLGGYPSELLELIEMLGREWEKEGFTFRQPQEPKLFDFRQPKQPRQFEEFYQSLKLEERNFLFSNGKDFRQKFPILVIINPHISAGDKTKDYLRFHHIELLTKYFPVLLVVIPGLPPSGPSWGEETDITQQARERMLYENTGLGPIRI